MNDWKIFQGNSEPHDHISELPEPPSWRKFINTDQDLEILEETETRWQEFCNSKETDTTESIEFRSGFELDKIGKQLDAANKRLKASNTGIKIFRRGQKLSLRGMLPNKNADDKSQKTISLGIYCNAAGIQSAEKQAQKLASQLALKEFDWDDWLNRKESVGTFEYWV